MTLLVVKASAPMTWLICVVLLAPSGFAADPQNVPPTIDMSDSVANRNIIIGPRDTHITLTCAAYGNPQPTITWLRDSRVLAEDNYTLLLDVTGEADTFGTYVCVANNTEGSVRSDYMTVSEPPSKRAMLASDIHNNIPDPVIHQSPVGESVLLTCGAAPSTASTAFKHYWRNVALKGPLNPDFNGHPRQAWRIYDHYYDIETDLNNDADLYGGRVVLYGRDLLITYVTESDRGLYTCIGGERDDILNYALHFLNTTTANPADGVLEFLPEYYMRTEKTIHKGDDLDLDCVPRAHPTPTVQWFKDNNPLSNGDRLHITNNNRSLSITSTEAGDAGDYRCTAAVRGKSNVPVTINQTTKVTVEYAPVQDPKLLSRNQTVLLGSEVTFHCRSDAVPSVTVQWFINGREISGIDYRWTFGGDGRSISLEDYRESDKGTVLCNVSNTRGYFLHTAFLTTELNGKAGNAACGESLQTCAHNAGDTQTKDREQPIAVEVWIGVGVAVGATFLLVVGGYCLYRRVKRPLNHVQEQVGDLEQEVVSLKSGKVKENARPSWRNPKLFRSISTPPQVSLRCDVTDIESGVARLHAESNEEKLKTNGESDKNTNNHT